LVAALIRIPHCRECKRLNEDYSAANTIFLAVAREQLHAVDSAALSEGEERYPIARQRRRAVLRALNAHKETHSRRKIVHQTPE